MPCCIKRQKIGFNWRKQLKAEGQGYPAIAKAVMKLLDDVKEDLGEYFGSDISLRPDTFNAFKLMLNKAIADDEITLQLVSDKEIALKELRNLTGRPKVMKASVYTWNNSDF